MEPVSKRHQDQLTRIKENIRKNHDAFKHNYDRYNEFRRFVFESSLREEDITLLMTLSKPQLEFNVLEAYISRLLGEFSKQEPSIEISADNENQADPQTIHVVEQHLRHILFDSQNHHTKYEVYKDLLSGGFSVFKVTTDYAHPMSFNQVIKFDHVYDPTLCGFDQLARESHKGDGRFCFELFPMDEDSFKEQYPEIPVERLSFRRDFAGFNWSFLNNTTKMIMVADYYEKKPKRVKIVQLVDGRIMTMKKYDEMVATWQDFVPPPAIMGKPRFTQLDQIVRYRLIENQIIEYTETDYSMLPLIFVDGSSVVIKTPKNGNVRQVCRPYVYHAKGAQRLKNFAGIALANEIENTVQHKFIIKKEALPKEEELLQAIKDIQKPSNIVVNAYYEGDPKQPIPEPIREVGRMPAPPEIAQGFLGADSLVQNILGSYDASLGINNNQLSGVAVVEAATQSNAAAMPYIVGFLQGLQRVAQIIIDLIPKYYTTPRTIPILDGEGKKSYVRINDERDPNSVDIFYDQNALNVKVEAGINFQVQKSKALQQIIGLMQTSPQFAQFMNEKGLRILLDNIEIRGVDQIKQMSEEWMREVQQKQQQMMQMQQAQSQENPLMIRNQIEISKMHQEAEENRLRFELEKAKLAQSQAKLMAEIKTQDLNNAVKLEEVDVRRQQIEADVKLKHQDQHHRHGKEAVELHHRVHKEDRREHGSDTHQEQ